MKSKWPLVLLIAAIAILTLTSTSDLFTVDEIQVHSITTDDSGVQIHFSVPAGEECPGIWIQTEASTHFISFAKTLGEHASLVDIPCDTPADLLAKGQHQVTINASSLPSLSSGKMAFVQVGPYDSKVIGSLEYGDLAPLIIGEERVRPANVEDGL